MSRMPWNLLREIQPRAHLVAGWARTEADTDLRTAQVVLERLAREQKPSGDYASTIVREAGRPEVHLGFKDKRDARKFAEAVGAQTTNNYPAWATQQAFEFDVVRIAELAASLPPPKPHSKPAQAGSSFARRRRFRFPDSPPEE
jgi:hypothetical protein